MGMKFKPLHQKVAFSSEKYEYYEIPQGLKNAVQWGAILPQDMIVIDVDCLNQNSFPYINWIKQKYPNILITKTLKIGGFHLYFKHRGEEKIHGVVGALTMFGFRIDVKAPSKREGTYIVLPDNYAGRRYYNGPFQSMEELACGWDEYDVELPENMDEVCPFINKTPPISINMPTKENLGARNDMMMRWLGYFVAKGVAVDTVRQFMGVLAEISSLEVRELEKTILASLTKYDIEQKDASSLVPHFYGGSLLELSEQLKSFVMANKIAGYDDATGLGYVDTGTNKYENLTLKNCLAKLRFVFCSRIFLQKANKASGKKGYSEVKNTELNDLLSELISNIRYNSREKMYDSIPEWDKKERISTFMKRYFACDANPNFFWLFMTALVGKIKHPEKTYVPYHFDFVSYYKGVGKTSFLRRIAKYKWIVEMSKGRSGDDMYANAYAKNALILLDDECSCTDPEDKKSSISYNDWKRIVTADVDVFSRKFEQTESHARSFIICRTSNEVRTGQDPNERRQIIFESKLRANDCRIAKLPDEFMDQLLAEAKVYFERNGVYQLTKEDQECIRLQQIAYYNCEKNSYVSISEYVKWARENNTETNCRMSGYMIYDKDLSTKYAITWETYRTWIVDYKGHGQNTVYSGTVFWDNIDAIASKTGMCSTKQKGCLGNSQNENYALLYVDDEDVSIPDLNYSVENIASIMSEMLDDSTPEIQTTSATPDTPKPTAPVQFSALETELGARRLPEAALQHKFRLPLELYSCPDSVIKFFESYAGNSTYMRPREVPINALMNITYGLGGAHFGREKEATGVIHADVNSMYPNIMIKHGLLSRAITKPDVYKEWVDKRLLAKQEGNTKLADELKFKINIVSGLMRCPQSALYDPEFGDTLCVFGQIFITLLVCQLIKAKCTIINVNTDGIIFEPSYLDGRWKTICDEWSQQTQLDLSFSYYQKITQADVNNYRAILKDGTEIIKGAKFKNQLDNNTKDNTII